MMNCFKCGEELKEDFKVCPYCGTKIVENPVVCNNCGEVVSGNFEICSECGKRLDGKEACYNCGLVVEKTYKYCPQCAAPLNKIVNPSNVKSSKSKNELSLVSIIAKSCITMFSLFMLIFSFLNIHTIEIETETLFQVRDSDEIEMKVSTFDMVQALFEPDDYSLDDFKKEYYEVIRQYDYLVDENSTSEEYFYGVEYILNKTNSAKFIKAMMNEETSEYMVDPYIVVNSITGILLIIGTVLFFAYNTYDLCKEIANRKRKILRYPFFETGIIALFVLANVFNFNIGVIHSEFESIYTAILGLAITCLLCRLGLVIYNQIIEKKSSGYLCFFSCFKVFLCSIAIGFSLSSSLGVDYAVNNYKVYRESFDYNMKDCFNYYTTSVYAWGIETETQYKNNLEEMIIFADENKSEGSEDLAKYYLSPYSLNRVYNIEKYENSDSLSIFFAASIMQLIIIMVLLMIMCFELGLKENKIIKISLSALLVCLNIVVFAGSLVAFEKIQSLIMEMKLNNIIRGISMGSGVIVAFVVSLGVLASQFFKKSEVNLIAREDV